MKASVKIFLTQYQENTNTENPKLKFWQPIMDAFPESEHIGKKYDTAEKCENYFRFEFAEDLKQKILNDLNSQIKGYDYEDSDRLFYRLLDEHRRGKGTEQEEVEYIRAMSTLFEKNGELRNNLYKENKAFQQLLNKRLLVSQLSFAVKNIRYASLGFDLIIEPTQKVIDFCDNNIEYLQVFLGGFIADTFRSEFSDYNNRIQFDASVEIDKTEFQDLKQRRKSDNNLDDHENSQSTKLDKAKWYWMLANGSLVIPVIISIYLLYNYQAKLDTVQSTSDRKVDSIIQYQDKLIKQYQEAAKRNEHLENRIIDSFFIKKQK
ncbi:MAG: hypothetical protein V4539_01190 [Bacteroidota bacterium]